MSRCVVSSWTLASSSSDISPPSSTCARHLAALAHSPVQQGSMGLARQRLRGRKEEYTYGSFRLTYPLCAIPTQEMAYTTNMLLLAKGKGCICIRVMRTNAECITLVQSAKSSIALISKVYEIIRSERSFSNIADEFFMKVIVVLIILLILIRSQ